MKAKKRIVIGIILFAAVLLLPFSIPVPPLDDTVSVIELAAPDSKFALIDDLRVHYKEAGEGEPAFILLHGFGASEFTWKKVFQPLAQLGRVVAYDRPGFGLTERPLSWEGENPYGAEYQSRLVFKLMDTLFIDRAILVGNSAGGTVAMNAYLRGPERIAGLILVDPAVYEGGGSPAVIRPLLNTPQADRLGPLLARNIQNLGRSFFETAWNDPSQITPDLWEGYLRPLRAENWDIGLWNIIKASQSSDLGSQLEAFDIATLVITGDDDRIVPTSSSIRLSQELPNAILAVLPDCGHLPQEECPEAFLSAVIEFSSTIARPGEP